jgi:hypothetical protein
MNIHAARAPVPMATYPRSNLHAESRITLVIEHTTKLDITDIQ